MVTRAPLAFDYFSGFLVFIERSEEVNREAVTFLKPRNPQKRRGREGHRPRISGAKL
jgi:hypothetical protein